jgi:hypothetical protein
VFSCGAACLLSVAARFGIADTKGICDKPGTCQATPLRQCNVGDFGKGVGAGAGAKGKNNDDAMGESGGASSPSNDGASPGSLTASFIEQGASFAHSAEQESRSSAPATTDDAASSAPTPFHHDSQTGTPKLHTGPTCSLSSAAEAQMYRLTSNMVGDEWSPDMIFRRARYVDE